MMASIRNYRRFLAYALQQAENAARQAFGVCESNARKNMDNFLRDFSSIVYTILS